MMYAYPFTQIFEDVQLELNEASALTSVENKYKNRVNFIYQIDAPSRGNFDWTRQEGIISLSESYSTGTVSIDAGDTALTGDSTVWTSSHDGWKIKISGNDEIYTFTYVSGTSGTISPALTGDTDLVDASYILYQDIYDLAADFQEMTSEPGVYYNYSSAQVQVPELDETLFRTRYVTDSNDVPTGWRLYPTLSTNGTKRLQIIPPLTTSRILNYEYTRILPELYEVTDTAKTGSTTTKVLTTNNLYSKISTGMYFRVDGDYQWVKITAVAADTTTGSGITVETLRTAPDNTDAITICSAPAMPVTMQRALFFGACWLSSLDQNDRAATAYYQDYIHSLGMDIKRTHGRRWGKEYMRP